MSRPSDDAGAGADTDGKLYEWRHAASQQSKGESSEDIHAAIDRRLVEVGAAGDLLDFGAGTGALSRRLQGSGRFRSITGADLYPRAAELEPAIAWLQGDLNNRLPAPDGSFDTVVAAEVIEHLENPRAMVREIFRLLRPNGWALLSTPNNESWRALISLLARGHFVAFGETSYPAHITALLRKDLERVLREAGFQDPTCTFTDVGGIPGLPSRSWQSLLGARVGGVRFSDNVLVAARKPGP